MMQKAVDWLRHDKKSRTAALIFLGLLCANVLAYFLFLMPEAGRLKEREARCAELRKRVAEAVLFKKQKEALAGLKAGIPAQKDMPLLVKELVQTARRLHLSVAAVNYDISRREREGLTMLSFSFPVEGSYPDLKRFIYEIETSGRLLVIEGLDLGSDKGRVKLQMKLMTYIKGSEKSVL